MFDIFIDLFFLNFRVRIKGPSTGSHQNLNNNNGEYRLPDSLEKYIVLKYWWQTGPDTEK